MSLAASSRFALVLCPLGGSPCALPPAVSSIRSIHLCTRVCPNKTQPAGVFCVRHCVSCSLYKGLWCGIRFPQFTRMTSLKCQRGLLLLTDMSGVHDFVGWSHTNRLGCRLPDVILLCPTHCTAYGGDVLSWLVVSAACIDCTACTVR